ncbi:hypothetical protein ACI784_22825 [Geodermatophilus sp. SYSU D01186]
MAAEVATSSFRGDPQPVEVFHAGHWFPGDLLGWRFDETGTCRVRVRCVVGGLRHTAWTDLAHLRLPTAAVVPAPAVEAVVPVSPPVPVPRTAPGIASGRARPTADGDTGRHPLLPGADRHPAPPAVPRPRRAGLVEWVTAAG